MNDMTATIRTLTIGAGTDYDFAPEWPTGIMDTPGIRSNDIPRPRAQGVIPNDDYMASRPISFVCRLVGTKTVVEQDITDLGQAFAPGTSEETLTCRLSGTPSEYAFFGRCRGIAVQWRSKAAGTHVCDVLCQFEATDPVRYGATSTQEIGLTTPTLPETLPFILGYYDSETVANSGTFAVDRWSVDFDAVAGTIVSPSIMNVTSDQIIRFNDTTIASGDTLTLDGQTRRATMNGSVIVPTTAEWWSLASGNNTIRFACGSASSSTSTATVTWRPGWV